MVMSWSSRFRKSHEKKLKIYRDQSFTYLDYS